ncbi:glutamyl-tRNA synthetase [Methylobacterium sp. 4-46]|uniref:Glutamate--tRNA ligase 2 n=1 Tax=Methylobacterium sp. (strain 4-46) TaxID=426117 RepID=SYE2_METS4|nr:MULTISPECIES: glutamate--tRNA ligase [Methylobacterium]B0UL61.1 RecName: Full=Glutamate--tRNA ligase 2; AltName: Full=Glutamyl-tRNA synthetase 2; Short=GluRS 2 [Methylobacterium sp. 4-46]ACA17061.1 glutamyl-tRNA synthetase [Methylobacterium sp. 4-46]WFT82749.1 glutamate--tRNA ligase [Methylobacterium nodulans]
MAPVVRFAPSPTGYLHIGNARPALFNALFARRAGGRFVLRLDDTDTARSTPEFAAAIVEDLAWLGIVPDETLRQSDRIALYDAAAERLRAAGRLYPAYETSDELERRRRRQLGRGLPPVYDRAALRLTAEERAAFEAEGRRPHWRFRLDPGPVTWTDLVRGPCHVEADSLSDPVLVREDGSYLYTLPSVVDDAEIGITHVIRGEDHVTNTAVQIQIFRALGAAVPVFAHHNLLTTASGEGLSKRLGHLSLRGLRDQGYEPGAVASLAVLTGSSEAVRAVPDLDGLAALLDLAHVSRAPAKFDPHDLDQLNARLLHEMPLAAAAPRLAALGIPAAAAEPFWAAVRANLATFSDAAGWWRVVAGPAAPLIADPALAARAAALLPPEPWDATTWKSWTEAVKAATGLKGKALFLPLRLALTGLDHGPDLSGLLPLIGRERAQRRLRGEAA